MLDAAERGTAAVGGYIVKSWGSDYPQLAANEFFCMTAAKLAGLPVPEFREVGERMLVAWDAGVSELASNTRHNHGE